MVISELCLFEAQPLIVRKRRQLRKSAWVELITAALGV